MILCVKAITVRFHLSYPAEKQAWDKLNALRGERHQSFSQAVTDAVNAYDTKGMHLSRTEKDELVQDITESVALRLQRMLPSYLAGYSAGASAPVAMPPANAASLQPATTPAQQENDDAMSDFAPPEYADRNVLWNSVEWNETKANAQLARSIELALPAELNHEQNIALIRKYVRENFVDKGMCADVAFHDKGDGNPHVHILLTMRPLTADGKWGDKSRLEYVLDADGNRIPAKQKGRWKTRKVNTTDWDDRGNAERWRAAAADAINEALREAGFTQGFVDPRSYADQGVQRIPMIHEGPDARAMEKRGIPTEFGEKNREIRQQNKLLIQLEARLARLNAWAQYEKKKDALLIEQGEDVSRPSLRYTLASNILASSVQPNRKDHRLRDSTGLLSIMQEYNITDAASCAAAIQQLNTELYSLRSKRKETHDLTVELSARIDAYEKWKKYRKHYQAWEKLPEKKRSDYERSHEYELRQYRQAAAALHCWQADGEKIDYKGWKAALGYLNKEQFMLDYQLQEIKEKVRRMEVVKREFIQENKQRRPERYAR